MRAQRRDPRIAHAFACRGGADVPASHALCGLGSNDDTADAARTPCARSGVVWHRDAGGVCVCVCARARTAVMNRRTVRRHTTTATEGATLCVPWLCPATKCWLTDRADTGRVVGRAVGVWVFAGPSRHWWQLHRIRGALPPVLSTRWRGRSAPAADTRPTAVATQRAARPPGAVTVADCGAKRLVDVGCTQPIGGCTRAVRMPQHSGGQS